MRKISFVKKHISKFSKVTVSILICAIMIVSAGLSISATGNKTAKLTLTATNSSRFDCIRKNDIVTIVASISELSAMKDGLYGFTMDISYNGDKFDYVKGSIACKAGSNFTVKANEAEKGVVTVLFTPNSKNGSLSFINQDAELFSLNFKVKADAKGSYAFTPSDCKFADKKNSNTGFELVTLNSSAKDIALKKIVSGDINGNDAVDIRDLVALKKHVSSTSPLTGGALLAANTTDPAGDVDAEDLVGLKKILIGAN